MEKVVRKIYILSIYNIYHEIINYGYNTSNFFREVF
jgi:hypothetical protein